LFWVCFKKVKNNNCRHSQRIENILDYKNLIIDFIETYLDGNIENLRSFDIGELGRDRKFGKTTSSGFDADDTVIVRAICFLVWKDRLPELKVEQIGTGKYYRGDTLNSFHSLFGQKLPGKNKFKGVAKYTDEINFTNSVNKFYKTYRTMGNFMLLPNIPLEGSIKTINLHRGSCSWHDYFDRFLLELNCCFIDHENKNQVLTELIERNNFYFRHFHYDIKRICKVNFLEPYFNSGEVKQFFYPYKYHWEIKKPPTKFNKREYISYANNYINRATKIINYRADKIISKLKSELSCI